MLNAVQDKLTFLKVQPFFNKDAKNRRDRLNHFYRKTLFKNIINAPIKRVRATLSFLEDKNSK